MNDVLSPSLFRGTMSASLQRRSASFARRGPNFIFDRRLGFCLPVHWPMVTLCNGHKRRVT